MYKKDERLVATIDDPSIQPRKSVYRVSTRYQFQRLVSSLNMLLNFLSYSNGIKCRGVSEN